MNDPDTLHLTRTQILDKFTKIEKDIMKSNEGKLSQAKFKVVFAFINWLVKKYDLEVLNRIFLSMIKEFDEMRYTNALEGNTDNDKTLQILKEIKDKKND